MGQSVELARDEELGDGHVLDLDVRCVPTTEELDAVGVGLEHVDRQYADRGHDCFLALSDEERLEAHLEGRDRSRAVCQKPKSCDRSATLSTRCFAIPKDSQRFDARTDDAMVSLASACSSGSGRSKTRSGAAFGGGRSQPWSRFDGWQEDPVEDQPRPSPPGQWHGGLVEQSALRSTGEAEPRLLVVPVERGTRGSRSNSVLSSGRSR